MNPSNPNASRFRGSKGQRRKASLPSTDRTLPQLPANQQRVNSTNGRIKAALVEYIRHQSPSPVVDMRQQYALFLERYWRKAHPKPAGAQDARARPESKASDQTDF